MRKILIGVLVCIVLAVSAYVMVNGVDKINVKGYKELTAKDESLQKEISQLTSIINVSFQNAKTELENTANTLQQSKVEYENQAILSESNSSSYLSNTEKYDIDYLWTKLGNYAKEEGVVIKIEVVNSGVTSGLYDLNFTAIGSYVGTTNFIYDIENDSKLGFKIDNFSMKSDNENSIIATFTCKDIPIEVGNVDATNSTINTQTNTDVNSTVNSQTNTSVPETTAGNSSNTTTNAVTPTTQTNTTTNTTTTTTSNTTVNNGNTTSSTSSSVK